MTGLLLGYVVLERLLELVISTRNTRRLLAEGLLDRPGWGIYVAADLKPMDAFAEKVAEIRGRDPEAYEDDSYVWIVEDGDEPRLLSVLAAEDEQPQAVGAVERLRIDRGEVSARRRAGGLDGGDLR